MIRIEGIHHVSLIVTDLQRAESFYRNILGLKDMTRPPFDFPGAWFSVGDTGQQLHLIVHPGETLRDGGIDTRDGHFAMRVENYGETIEWLKSHDIAHTAKPNSITGFAQIFLLDPDKNIVELNAARP